MKIVRASFFWKNNQPGGLGFSFCPPGISEEVLQQLFDGELIKTYMRDSDNALGSGGGLVKGYLEQLDMISRKVAVGGEPTMQEAVLAALNITYLCKRGFIPQDEYNGYQFLTAPA